MVNNMLKKNKDQLTGKDNKRLFSKKPTNSEATAAWQNSESEYPVEQVNHPALDEVTEAKDWVDNGSKL